MSFDLSFLPRPANGDWDSALESFERRASQSPTKRDLVMWERIGQRLEFEMPTMEASAIEGGRSYADAECGLELTLTSGEIALSAPRGLAEVDALVVLDMLRRTAAIVETVTGLVAYDARAEASFLHDDHDPFVGVPAQLRALSH